MSLLNNQYMFWPTGQFRYERHCAETTLLYQLVERHWPDFKAMLSAQGKQRPGYVVRDFDDYLKCGRLEHSFLQVRCDTCHHEKLVAFSCKRRGFYQCCGARRMVDRATHLFDEFLTKRPIRQWVMSQVPTIVQRVISTFLIRRARMPVKSGAQSGAVTLIQRFGSALNLNPYFHMLYMNGIYDAKGYLWPVRPPTCEDLDVTTNDIILFFQTT
ncbi:MAG: hypothetical protein ACI9VI_001038 [Candidatus Azotimanducaceae bacterium]